MSLFPILPSAIILVILLQESVLANSSAVADGVLHSVALVVTTSNITFYMDAKVQVPTDLFDDTQIRFDISTQRVI